MVFCLLLYFVAKKRPFPAETAVMGNKYLVCYYHIPGFSTLFQSWKQHSVNIEHQNHVYNKYKVKIKTVQDQCLQLKRFYWVITWKLLYSQGVILETEGSIQKLQKRTLFCHRKVKKGTPNLTSPYVHNLFTIFLIKQVFEKNKSLRAASGSQTQF